MSIRSALAATLLLTVTACNTAGPTALRSGRVLYNEAVNLTTNEQLLLNLVRLRYRDTPTFLSLASISTQYTLSGSASVDLSGADGDAVENWGTGIGIGYTEKPTISFTPLQGERFVTQMLKPIEPDVIALLSHSGWNLDRVIRVILQGVNGVPNAPNASSPTPSAAPEYADFKRAAELLKILQKRGHLEFGREPAGDGFRLVLRFANEALESSELQELRELVHLEAHDEYEVTFTVLGGGGRVVGTNMRSAIGVMYFLSQGVDVPAKDEEAGLVTITRTPEGQRFDWNDVTGDLLHIRWSDSKPAAAAVAVKYRGTWFYVDDADLTSKSTFSMLTQLLALQAGGVPSTAPVLTLPLG